MESEISRVKGACVLSGNQIRETVTDSDSSEKYYTSEDTEDDKPHPPTWQSSISEPPSPDFSASSSEDEDDVGNVAGQQPQPCLWTLPPLPWRRVVHTFTGAPNAKSREAAHVTSETTPLSILLLFFAEIGCGDELLLSPVLRKFWRQAGDRSRNVCVFGSDITDGTYSSRQTGGLLDKNGTASHSILWTNDGTW